MCNIFQKLFNKPTKSEEPKADESKVPKKWKASSIFQASKKPKASTKAEKRAARKARHKEKRERTLNKMKNFWFKMISAPWKHRDIARVSQPSTEDEPTAIECTAVPENKVLNPDIITTTVENKTSTKTCENETSTEIKPAPEASPLVPEEKEVEIKSTATATDTPTSSTFTLQTEPSKSVTTTETYPVKMPEIMNLVQNALDAPELQVADTEIDDDFSEWSTDGEESLYSPYRKKRRGLNCIERLEVLKAGLMNNPKPQSLAKAKNTTESGHSLEQDDDKQKSPLFGATIRCKEEKSLFTIGYSDDDRRSCGYLPVSEPGSNYGLDKREQSSANQVQKHKKITMDDLDKIWYTGEWISARYGKVPGEFFKSRDPRYLKKKPKEYIDYERIRKKW